MNWKNLDDGLCPKCDKALHHNPAANMMLCRCGFKIGMEKFKEITSKRASGYRSPMSDDPDERLSELNNL